MDTRNMSAADSRLSSFWCSWPSYRSCCLLPHRGGRSQWLLHRLGTLATRISWSVGELKNAVIGEEDKALSAVYHAELIYEDELPPAWHFA